MTSLFAWNRTPFVGLAAVLIALAGIAGPSPASAQTEINITDPTFEPMPVAIPDFSAQSQVPSRLPEMSKPGTDMAGVINADLERSGLFRPLPKASFIEQGLVPER